MERRDFLKTGLLGSIGFGLAEQLFSRKEDIVIGHGDFRYKVDLNWGALNRTFFPVKDCHEMVEDSQGRILLLTNHTRNNVLIYDKSGKLLDSWGTTYPGAHGLTLKNEGGEDFLYIADNDRHEVIKTTIEGREVMKLPVPSDIYERKEDYIPTETAVADNGDIYVADGYGQQHILHYDAQGRLKNVFGGRGDGSHRFSNAHGICIDGRGKEDSLLITDRMTNQLKRFSMGGQYLETIELPGAFICRPVIKDDQVYLATIWSGDGSPDTGFVSILDRENQLVSAPGGTIPRYQKGTLNPIRQAFRIFHHPHDVCVDRDDNLYIPQWNSGASNPVKLIRV